MLRKTLWTALAVLIALIASAPFVLADPPTPQRAESAPDADLTALPRWAEAEQPAHLARQPSAIQATLFSENFSGGYPPAGWAETQGVLADPTSFSGATSSWVEDGFANNGTTGSAKLNIYGTTRDEWMFTPQIDLGLAGDNQLEFDLALTPWNGTGASTLGVDDIFAVVISNTGVVSTGSVLQQWDSSTPISNLGDHIIINLAGHTGIVQFGFYGFSDTSNQDNDLFVDNIKVGTPNAYFGNSAKTADPMGLAFTDKALTYTIIISNSGGLSGTNTTLVDPIPAGVIYVPGSCSGGCTYNGGLDQVQWSGVVTNSASVTLTFQVTVTASSGAITNIATISDPLAAAPVDVMAVNLIPVASLNEDFENGGAIPAGWTNDPDDAGEDWLFGTSATYGASADHTTGSGYFAWLDDSSTHNTPTNLLSPYVDLSAYANPILKFWLWNMNPNFTGYPTSTLAVDVYDGSTWNDAALVIDTAFTAWTQFSLDLTPYQSNANRIRFRGIETGDFYSDISIDDVSISEPAPSFAGSYKTVDRAQVLPGDLLTYTIYITNSGGLASSAGLMLDQLPAGLQVHDASIEGGGALSFGLDWAQWSTAPGLELAPGQGATLTIVATSTLGLECGASFINSAVISDANALNEEPVTAPPVNVISTLPALAEDFENGGAIPVGWINDPGDAGENWLFGASATYGAAYDHSSGSGYFAWIDDSDPNAAAPANLLSAPTDLGGLTAPTLKFWLWNVNPDYTGYPVSALHVDISATNWISDVAVIDQELTEWTLIKVDLTPYAGNVVQVRFRAMETLDYHSDISVDDVSIAEPWYPCPSASIGLDQSGSACWNSSVTYPLTVDNANDVTDVLDVTLEGDGWPATVNPDSLTLGPGESGVVTVSVEVPLLVNAGATSAVTVTATAQGSGLSDQATLDTYYTGVGSAWETVAPLPQGRVFEAVVGTDDYVFVIGGASDASGFTPVSTTYRYDIAADAWTTMTAMPVVLSQIGAGLVGDKIYVPGGNDGAAWDDNTYVYDIPGDSWSVIAANGTFTGAIHYAVAVDGDTLYRLGGMIDDGFGGLAGTARVWALDTLAGTWSELPPMQQDRTNLSAGVIGGNLYVAGGFHHPGFTPEMTSEVYTSTWGYVAPVPDGGGAYDRWAINGYATANAGLFLMAGLRDASWNVLDHTGFYDPASDSWLTSPALPLLNQPRVYLGGGAGRGYLFASGGRDSSGSIIYDSHERLGLCATPWIDSVAETAQVYAGDQAAFSLSYGNYGPSAAYDVTISNTFPISAPYSGSDPSGTVLLPADTVIWGAPLVAAGTSETITVNVMLSPTLPPGAEVVIPDYIVWRDRIVDTVETTFEVVQAPCNPVTGADFDYSPAAPEVNETVVFTGTANEGTFVLPITYTWDFGDGGTATGVNATHTFTQSGDYTVWMTASNCGGVSVISRTVTVAPLACDPVTGADFDYSPATPDMYETVVFTGTVAGGEAPIAYAWDWGDDGTATGVNATHVFTQSGDFTVWMTATNCSGAGVSAVSRSVSVAVAVCAPVTGASFDYTPSQPMVDETITFDAAYTPANATTYNLTYDWNFGGVLKSGASVTHTYDAPGTFGITLTVANECTALPVEYIGSVTVAGGTYYLYLPVVLKTD